MYFPGICAKGLQKPTKTLSLDSLADIRTDHLKNIKSWVLILDQGVLCIICVDKDIQLVYK
jgi:hypothetical protein